MNAAKPEMAWKCDECGEIHDNENYAYECCQPQVIEGYLCPICRDFHLKKSGALDCCGDAPPTAAEIEAAGQQRLIP